MSFPSDSFLMTGAGLALVLGACSTSSSTRAPCGEPAQPGDSADRACVLQFNEQHFAAAFVETSNPSATGDHFVLEALRSEQTYTLVTRGIEPCPPDVVITSEISAQRGASAVPLLAPEEQTATKRAREFRPGADGPALIHVRAPCSYELFVYESTDDGLGHGADFEPNDSPSTAPWVLFELGQQTDGGLVSTLRTPLMSGFVEPGFDPEDYYVVDGFFPGDRYVLEARTGGTCSIVLSTQTDREAPWQPLISTLELASADLARDFAVDAEVRGLVRVSGDCLYELGVLRR